ncbi:hypothetical protein PoB_000071500 [Plakobranchus ocellatus]|uniref:Flavin-containing monooxygenase n=1 Tax=Plakobranchus ocellatus TaxID=259542 RepID=A0AAV3XTH0_9GAST|nr:hypothetical protein PoB_000071500 [Plakobranchus ocellatus]
MLEKDVVVIGAGISGLATAKCLKDDGFDVVVLERSGDIGGLWNYREDDYGVMKFTHINVSKYNYAFSDYPFPEDVPDYPHHTDMCRYIHGYAQHFGLLDMMLYNVIVTSVEQIGEKWRITGHQKLSDSKDESQEVVYVSQFVAITTGHHAKPAWPKFRGFETFTGSIIHSVSYKDAIYNDLTEKRVLVVGIGNSAVDVAVNCVDVGRCKPVCVSTRSGAWIIPNYLFGFPTDLYASRLLFKVPWYIINFMMETLIRLNFGSPWKWGLNPKMKALQTQPTVSPTLIHHVQRGNIKIYPNITHIENNLVHFVNGCSREFDQIICCTGYSIDLPFLSQAIRDQVLDKGCNQMKHMDQSVIHHPLESLTQAAREINRSIVGRIRKILPGFCNWNHRSLPPKWEDVPGGPNVIKEFKKSMQAGFRKVPQELIVNTIRACGRLVRFIN